MQIHHKYTSFVCVYAFICICVTFYIFPILLPMNCHSDYESIDGCIAVIDVRIPIYFKGP